MLPNTPSERLKQKLPKWIKEVEPLLDANITEVVADPKLSLLEREAKYFEKHSERML